MDEEKHLRNLAYHPHFTFDWSKEFDEEMWRLWRRRLIKEKHGDRTLRKMERKEEGDRFEDYFEISAAGSEYLRLREEVDGDREIRSVPRLNGHHEEQPGAS